MAYGAFNFGRWEDAGTRPLGPTPWPKAGTENVGAKPCQGAATSLMSWASGLGLCRE